ncbi:MULTISPECIES: hypothetical protein [unclassified Stenotrophomonas]|uniref:hypothetical protein n=1 Tax=unclassified Stenotrophomonas TaxID=196198 RepID=UPI003465BBE5
MQDILKFGWAALQALGGLGVLAAAVAFFFREKIKHSLLESMQMRLEGEKAQLALDHARYSSQLAMDAENHRVSLIAESERLKANQQIKTSLALRLGERRFESICAVHAAVAGIPPAARGISLTLFTRAPAEFERRFGEVQQMLDEAINALKMNRAFISPELFRAGILVTSAVADVLGKRLQFDDPPLNENAHEVRSLVSTFREFEACLSLSLKPYDSSAWLE